jgi:hypothetical protein
MRQAAAVAVVVSLIVVWPVRPQAWGFEAHKLIAERAIDLLPAEIRPFFQKHRTFIVEHSVDPDLWRNAGFDEEPPRHFLDMDAYGAPPFADLPPEYDRAVQKYGADFVRRNGTLPWRVAEVYGQLRRSFDLQKRRVPGYALENVKFYSAVLAHYVADGHVPLHAVLNYDGQLTGQSGIHSRWETELVLLTRSQLHLTPPPVTRVTDPRAFMFDVLTGAFPYAEQILRADSLAVAGKDEYDRAYFDALFTSTRPILEQQLSKAVAAVTSVIASAWEDGGRPDLPLDPPEEVRKIRRAAGTP